MTTPPPSAPATSPTGTRRRRGLFVALEGIDGAGKSTTTRLAGQLLAARGVPVTAFDKKDTQQLPGPHATYLDQHLAALRAVIWEHPAGDPYLALGDLHWVHLQAAWYHAMTYCRLAPLLDGDRVVLTDTWLGKFTAKLALRPGMDMAAVQAAFAHLPTPDLVIYLKVTAEEAAARKQEFSISEAGNRLGPVELTTQNFTTYQRGLGAWMEDRAARENWRVVHATGMSPEAVAEEVADAIIGYAIATGAGLGENP